VRFRRSPELINCRRRAGDRQDKATASRRAKSAAQIAGDPAIGGGREQIGRIEVAEVCELDAAIAVSVRANRALPIPSIYYIPILPSGNRGSVFGLAQSGVCWEARTAPARGRSPPITWRRAGPGSPICRRWNASSPMMSNAAPAAKSLDA
jgi:hypothetical protein